MSSKIEVSRELLVRLNNLTRWNFGNEAECVELRALLDAPVAERQPSKKVGRFFPDGYSVVRQGEHSVSVEWSGISMSFSENEPDGRMGQLVDFLLTLIDAAPPELAELQAEMRIEIDRLKGGQREPVAWLQSKHVTDRRVPAAAREDRYNGYTIPVYLDRPAPVSVVPAEIHKQLIGMRQQFECANFVSLGKLLAACLDKVKELNQ